MARAWLRVRSPICTETNAMPAMIAAAGQCENEPNDRPMGLVDRDSDSRATPTHKISAPLTSVQWTACLDNGTARISANSRLVASRGSTSVSSRWPIDHAASRYPHIMHAMPISHRGLRSRSVRMRGLRKRDSGSCSAEYCCRTKPIPSSTAATSVVA